MSNKQNDIILEDAHEQLQENLKEMKEMFPRDWENTLIFGELTGNNNPGSGCGRNHNPEDCTIGFNQPNF